MRTSISVAELPSAVLRYLFKNLPQGEDTLSVVDADVAVACGVSVRVFRWALSELEDLGVLTYERLSPGRAGGGRRDIRIDLSHWLLEALGLEGTK